MSKIKMSITLVLICCFMLSLAGCGGDKAIEGEWVWSKSVYVNEEGQTVESDPKEIGITEIYTIKGSKIHYTYTTKTMTAPLESDLKLKKVADNTYNFTLAGNVVVENAVFEGNTFSYTTGADGTSKIIFERKIEGAVEESAEPAEAAEGEATESEATESVATE